MPTVPPCSRIRNHPGALHTARYQRQTGGTILPGTNPTIWWIGAGLLAAGVATATVLIFRRRHTV
ncbi:MAG: hypothetical protein FWF43_04420 [Propionibacteriaceae bacterium]|nr:hypothetical protein [Propionibacteriaceae bacterium]